MKYFGVIILLAIVLLQNTPCAAQVFVTIDAPSATNGTYLFGVDGQNMVGAYADGGGRHGFLYNGSTYLTLNDPSASSTYGGTSATGISGSNIVGYYFDSSDVGHGFLYNNGTYTTLDDPLATGGTFAFGTSGNSIVGAYFNSSGEHGFIDQGGVYTTVNYATANTELFGISGSNVVGSENGQGFLYNGTTFSFLVYPSAFSTSPSSISGNVIVGIYNFSSSGNRNGFLFDGSTYETINDPLGVKGTDVYGISGNTIVGDYYDSNNSVHGFETTLASVPEPSTWSLLFVSMGLLGLLIRWKKKEA